MSLVGSWIGTERQRSDYKEYKASYNREMMKVTKICVDIFDIGDIAFLLKTIHNEVYDFNFRNI